MFFAAVSASSGHSRFITAVTVAMVISLFCVPSPRFVKDDRTYFFEVRSLQRGWLQPEGIVALNGQIKQSCPSV
jgi:hypothetical protein